MHENANFAKHLEPVSKSQNRVQSSKRNRIIKILRTQTKMDIPSPIPQDCGNYPTSPYPRILTPPYTPENVPGGGVQIHIFWGMGGVGILGYGGRWRGDKGVREILGYWGGVGILGYGGRG